MASPKSTRYMNSMKRVIYKSPNGKYFSKSTNGNKVYKPKAAYVSHGSMVHKIKKTNKPPRPIRSRTMNMKKYLPKMYGMTRTMNMKKYLPKMYGMTRTMNMKKYLPKMYGMTRTMKMWNMSHGRMMLHKK